MGKTMNSLINFIINLFAPKSFMAFKSKLFIFLLSGLIIDFSLKIALKITNLKQIRLLFYLSGPEFNIILSCIICLIILVFFNFVLYYRKQKFSKEIIDFARDQNISENFRREIIDKIQKSISF